MSKPELDEFKRGFVCAVDEVVGLLDAEIAKFPPGAESSLISKTALNALHWARDSAKLLSPSGEG